MKHKIYLLSLLLFSSISLQATVYNGTCGTNLTWTHDTETGVLTVSGTGAMEDYYSAPWSSRRNYITSIVIQNGVTSIGNYAFDDCYNLTTLSIPNSITTIGEYAFNHCYRLTSLSIPNTVTAIGDYAFDRCSGLTSVILPESVTNIGKYAFSGIGLTSITIPNSVTSIGDIAFGSNITEVHISDIAAWCNITFNSSNANPLYYAHHLFLNDTEITNLIIPDGVTSIGNYACYNCDGLTSVTIPIGVTSIGSSAFCYCDGLTSVTIPNGVTSIGGIAFYGCCSLTSVTIPNSVTSFGNGAFYNVPNIKYSGEASGLPWGARSVNGLVDGWLVYNDESKTSLRACASSAVGSIDIPNSVTSIGDNTFYDCINLSSINLPNGVTSIGKSAFFGCTSLTSITIPYGVTSIGNNTFQGCTGLTAISIPNSVTSIGNRAFNSCTSLSSISIPYGVTSIGNEAFQYCTGLTSVTIPNGVTSIGESAFQYCNNLSSVHITDIAAWCRIVFSDGDGCNPLYYAHHLFLNDTEITNLIIPDGVTSIGNYAFYNCDGLTSVTIPNGVTSIGEYAFQGCSNLSSVTCLATTPPTLGNNYVFNIVPADAALYVPKGTTATYAAKTGWSRFAGHITGITRATIGVTGWTTFSCDAPLDLANMTASTGDAAAYYVSSANGSVVTLTETDTSVAANEGLMLKGTDGATITIPVATSGSSIEGNKLVGCPSGTTISTVTTNYGNIYVLANNEGTAQFENIKSYVDVHTFLSIGADKAYLYLEGITLAPGALGIVFEEDNATKLEALAETDKAVKFIENGQLLILRDGITYDAMGRVIR